MLLYVAYNNDKKDHKNQNKTSFLKINVRIYTITKMFFYFCCINKYNGKNKKFIKTETKTIIDHQTGEIIQTEHNQKGFVEKEPDYVKLLPSRHCKIK